MEGGLLLDVVIRQGTAILKLLACKDQSLLIRWDALLVLNLGLDVVNGVAGLHIQCDGLASQSLHKDLHASSQTQHQVEGGLLLDVVIRQGAAILKLLSCKDQSLLIRWDALLVLNLGLDVVNGVAGLHIQCDGLASQSLHKDLHASSQTQHQVEGGLLLDVVIRQGAAILKLLACKDQPLLIRWDALLVLNLGLDVVNGVASLHIQCDGLASQGLYKDLHASSQTQHQVEGGLLLDVVIRQGAAILKLLACKDQSLLIRWDALLVLNLGLDVVNGVAGLHIQCDGLASQGFHKDLHASSQTQHQVEGGLLLDVVIRQGAAILKLLACKDQSLLIRWDALLVLNLGLDVVNGVAGLHIQCDGLASQRFHKDLHASSQTQHQVEGGLLLDVVIRQGAAILKLLACKDQPLLIRWDALLVLNLGLDVVNGVASLHIQCDGLASQSLHKDLHASSQTQHQVEGGLLLDVVIREGAAILKLLACKDQPLLIRWDALLVLNLGLDVVNGVASLHIQRDGLASQGLHKDLHGFPLRIFLENTSFENGLLVCLLSL